MKRISLPLVILVVAGLALAACGAQPGTVGNQQPPRTVSVTASGTAYAAPDMAMVQIGVQQEGPNAQRVIDQVTNQANLIVDAVKALGVEDADIQTSQYNVYPNIRYDVNGQPVETVYVVSYTISVTFRDLDQLGDGLTAVTDAGANQIYGINFGVTDPSAAIAEAREAAIAAARTRAEQLAGGFGAQLGEVYTISEYSYNQPVPMVRSEMAVDMAMSGSVPVEGGSNSFQVEVNVTYTLR